MYKSRAGPRHSKQNISTCFGIQLDLLNMYHPIYMGMKYVEIFHRQFCKFLLKLGTKSSNNIVLGELGTCQN